MNPPLVLLDAAAHLPFLARALEEDHAAHDVTTRALVDETASARADVVVRAPGVLAGLPLALPVFRLLDPAAEVVLHQADGEGVAEGSIALTVHARARAILSAERTVLNLLGHLSGIATLTQAFVEAATGTGVVILDTRKTTPGLRTLEKYAVACGGGEPHRQDLEDAVMIKENHLYAAYGKTGPEAIGDAIRRCREAAPPGRRLHVEVENEGELEAALAEGPDVIMLDGFDLEGLRRAVRRVREHPAPRPRLEATGGVRLETVSSLAATGVDRLSSGALTHSAPSLDISLRVRG